MVLRGPFFFFFFCSAQHPHSRRGPLFYLLVSWIAQHPQSKNCSLPHNMIVPLRCLEKKKVRSQPSYLIKLLQLALENDLNLYHQFQCKTKRLCMKFEYITKVAYLFQAVTARQPWNSPTQEVGVIFVFFMTNLSDKQAASKKIK